MKYSRRHENNNEERLKRNLGVPNVRAIQNYFRSRQDTFTKSMQYIATSIIKHPEILKNSLLVTFSKTLNLGEASVMRFCKHLGFKGFTEFKHYFIDEFFEVPVDVSQSTQVYDVDFTQGTKPQEILNKIVNLVQHVSLETKKDLEQSNNDIMEVAEKIFYSARLFIYGTTSSKFIIEEIQHRFANIGITCIYATDLQEMIAKACLMQKGDVAIAISTSGYSSDLIKITNLLNKSRVHTVAITSDPRSELAINCSSTFYCYGSSSRSANPYQDSTYTRVSQMIIFDTLIAMVISFDMVRAREHRLTAYNTLDQVLTARSDSPTVI